MRWPWQKATAATVTADLPAVRCPMCSSIEGAAVLDIKSWSIARDGEVIERHIGRRVACQRCPTIYSVVGTGVFRHHPQSSPLTLEVRRAPDDDERPGSPPELPPQRQRPIPKERPRA